MSLADGVSGDDAHNSFVIRAGTRDTGSSDTGSTGSGGCAGCDTVIAVPVCVDGIGFVSPQPGSGCLALDGECPRGQRFVRQWTAGPRHWIQGEVACVALQGVPTLAQIAVAVRDRVVRHVPAARISTQPRSDMLVRLPVLLSSGQPDGTLQWNDEVAGVPVTTTVAPLWRWRFDRRTVLTTDRSGSAWPDTTVSHTFTDPGPHQIELETVWSGSFQIAGLSSQPIAGTVSQTTRRQVTLYTAGAVLQPALR